MFYKDKKVWWIPDNDLYISRDIQPKRDYFPVRFCNTCKRVWEKPLRYTRSYKVRFHEQFPTYGLTREVCYECIKRKKDRIYASRRKKSCKENCNCK